MHLGRGETRRRTVRVGRGSDRRGGHEEEQTPIQEDPGDRVVNWQGSGKTRRLVSRKGWQQEWVGTGNGTEESALWRTGKGRRRRKHCEEAVPAGMQL